MNAKQTTEFALDLPEAIEDHPFGPSTDVFKVVGRIFAILVPDEDPPRLSLKCDPKRAQLLRDQYAAITPGFHLNKRHWNTIELDGSVAAKEIKEMIGHSYDQVIAKLPKAERERLRRKA